MLATRGSSCGHSERLKIGALDLGVGLVSVFRVAVLDQKDGSHVSLMSTSES